MQATTICKVRLRSAPRRLFSVPLRTVPIGSEFQVLEWRGDWFKVLYQGTRGYLHRDSVELVNEPDQEYYELPEVLFKELEAILGARDDWEQRLKELKPLSSVTDCDKSKRFSEVAEQLHNHKLAALCLSGGGIRSATFNLGVLQGLAKCGVLRQLDYLSTVSGGGYIGGWFTSWISRGKRCPAQNLEEVSGNLARETPDSRSNEPHQIRFLRDYSNYLTPRVGIFSVDTWTIVGTYLRNLLLNWLVLLPLFFALVLAPRLLTLLMALAGSNALSSYISLFAAALLALFPIVYTVADLPSLGDMRQSKGKFVVRFLVPLVLTACLISAFCGKNCLPGCDTWAKWWGFMLFGALLHGVGWVAGMLRLKSEGGKKLPSPAVSGGCAAVAGGVAGLLAWLGFAKLMPILLQMVQHPKLLYATLSVPLVLGVYALTMTVLVAVSSKWTLEQDREWWGRAAGVVILSALVWGIALAVTFYAPFFLLPQATPFWQKVYAAIGAISGLAAAWLGKDASTPALRPGVSMAATRTTLLAAAALFFLLFLAQSLSLLATWMLWLWTDVPEPNCVEVTLLSCLPFTEVPPARAPFDFWTHLALACEGPLWLLSRVFLCCLATSLGMAYFVNVNTFSMHAMYRNRLVRCYLGASRDRKERKENPFTGFDGRDDCEMTELPMRPFHVVNIAWNLVKGSQLAWQQRKAASFTMSPLFAGGDIFEEPPRKNGKEKKCEVKPGGYRVIGEYGAGECAGAEGAEPSARQRPHPKRDDSIFGCPQPMTLGTAMAISGAAASPNMGYHSSPLVTFVMAFFNVRLGWWLGNPGIGMGSAWRKTSPRFSVLPLLRETFGFTREWSWDIYLSDGGHFENLGLYEMVRRRCHYLLVSDAGCDCDSVFQDLGNAVRKVRADFGIEIEIDCSAVRAKKIHFAVGKVFYSRTDEGVKEEGRLLYLKPVLTGDESMDEFNYSKMHQEFPHEPTSDQWFDEAQFESYRKLGQHTLAQLADDVSGNGQPAKEQAVKEQAAPGKTVTLKELFDRAQAMHDEALRKLKEEEACAAGKGTPEVKSRS